MKNLYAFDADCGRMGSISGRFLATPEEAEAIIGKHCYFGEVLGKHSDVHGEIEKDEISLVTDNQEFLTMADKLGVNLEAGLNPLNYYTCRECGDIMDVITKKCEYCNNEEEETK